MSANGQQREASGAGQVLRWPGRVLAAEDLRHSLDGHGELVLDPETVITPLAAEQLRAGGIRVTRQAPGAAVQPRPGETWGFGQERPYAAVHSAVQSLRREGLKLQELATDERKDLCTWARGVP